MLFICYFYFMNSDLDMPRKFTYKPCRLFFLNPCSMDHPKDWPLQQGICQKIPPVVHHDFTPTKPERC